MSTNRIELKSVFRDWLGDKGLWEVYVSAWDTYGIGRYRGRLDEWLDATSAGLWLQCAFPWNKTNVNWDKLNDEWIEVWHDREL